MSLDNDFANGRAPLTDDGGFSAYQPAWPEMDGGLLDDGRPRAEPFPLHLLPEEWQRWIADTAQAAGTAPDYVALGAMAAVAGLGGAGARVRITPAWNEPLVLWLALVGSPSSGKSPALASVRDQLGQIEEAMRGGDDHRRAEHAAKVEEARLASERWQTACEQALDDGTKIPPRPPEAGFDTPFVPSQLIVADATMEALADVVAGNPRGVILWRDELTAWLANLGRYASGGSDRAHWLEAWAAAGITVNRRSRSQPLHLPKFPVSVVGSIQPDRLAEAFSGSDDGMAARFLYAWPDLPKFTPLAHRRIPRDDQALAMLDAIAHGVGTAEQPLLMTLDQQAFELFDVFLAKLHAKAGEAQGFEEGWLGKGRGTVARLAGVLTLLDWSENGEREAPRGIGVDAMKRAVQLWGSYFHPQAQSIFNQAGRSDRDRDREARRVVRWLRANRVAQISREDVRRGALCQSVSADRADAVIAQLEAAAILRPAEAVTPRRGSGRPSRRWDVNPALLKA